MTGIAALRLQASACTPFGIRRAILSVGTTLCTLSFAKVIPQWIFGDALAQVRFLQPVRRDSYGVTEFEASQFSIQRSGLIMPLVNLASPSQCGKVVAQRTAATPDPRLTIFMRRH